MAACNQRYYNDVIEIRVDKFTRVYYLKNRYGMMSTQIAESMNSVLLDLRKRPIATIAEQTKDMMQNWFHNLRTIANCLRSNLTPATDNHILKGVEPSYKCIIHLISYHRMAAGGLMIAYTPRKANMVTHGLAKQVLKNCGDFF
ncbi:hypothetical protein LWI28_005808 [Acer negundo]|uniref:Uncharacterized protein n=1 Tax=Acer negundo TaxID=4023 RepID=A0AAD5NEC6_ACENE|nr:hypothetical protein LWI28_005808 [Acer negundo]